MVNRGGVKVPHKNRARRYDMRAVQAQRKQMQKHVLGMNGPTSPPPSSHQGMYRKRVGSPIMTEPVYPQVHRQNQQNNIQSQNHVMANPQANHGHMGWGGLSMLDKTTQ